MKFPIDTDSPEMKLAEAIAQDLVIDGVDGMLALPMAIRLMAVIDAAHDDPMIGVEEIRRKRQQSDEWWVQYHPKTKHAKQAKLRLQK
jgi:hypothetical protein